MYSGLPTSCPTWVAGQGSAVALLADVLWLGSASIHISLPDGGCWVVGSPAALEQDEKKPKWQPPKVNRVGRRARKRQGQTSAASNRLPVVAPLSKCRLRKLRLERIKDLLLLEEEFLTNQEAVKPREEADAAARVQVDKLRGTPMGVGSLEELIDDNHAIVSACGFWLSIPLVWRHE